MPDKDDIFLILYLYQEKSEQSTMVMRNILKSIFTFHLMPLLNDIAAFLNISKNIPADYVVDIANIMAMIIVAEREWLLNERQPPIIIYVGALDSFFKINFSYSKYKRGCMP